MSEEFAKCSSDTNDTPCRRRRDDGGKPSKQQIAAFGEQILFKPHKTNKLAVKWLDCCWLGNNTRTGQHIVSDKASVTTCRSIRWRNKEERWNRDMLHGIFGNL